MAPSFDEKEFNLLGDTAPPPFSVDCVPAIHSNGSNSNCRSSASNNPVEHDTPSPSLLRSLVAATEAATARASAPAEGSMTVPVNHLVVAYNEDEGRASSRGFTEHVDSAASAAVAGGSRLHPADNNEVASEAADLELLRVSEAPESRDHRMRWLRGRGRAALRVVRSTASFTLTVASAAIAILITFWALFPVCTSCRRRHDAVVAVRDTHETGRSTLYINQLQMIGTHNSYHRRTYVPAAGGFWAYHYPSLKAQLDAGVRHLELDIHYDWKTGRWFVFHLSVLDAMSTCNCLMVCLEEIREWSDNHPAHHIIFIEIELKLYGDFLRICGTKTPDTDRSAFLAMQETVIDVFPRSRILTPREVRGDYANLTEAVKRTTVTAESSHSSSTDVIRMTVPGTVPGNVPGTLSGTSPENTGPSISAGGPRDGQIKGGGGDDSSAGASSFRGVDRGDLGSEEVLFDGLGPGTGMAGGWPLVDTTRGMVLFVIDYQSKNVACRPAVRNALPEDETIFFERTPLREISHSTLTAFAEINVHSTDEEVLDMVHNGIIVRRRMSGRDWIDSEKAAGAVQASSGAGGAEFHPSYIVDTPAQLLVSDNLKPVERVDRGTTRQSLRGREQQSVDGEGSRSLPCRSRCCSVVPSDECVLEGFC